MFSIQIKYVLSLPEHTIWKSGLDSDKEEWKLEDYGKDTRLTAENSYLKLCLTKVKTRVKAENLEGKNIGQNSITEVYQHNCNSIN